MSRLDQLYRSLLLSGFFTKGWGQPENLKRLFEFRKIISNRETCLKLVSPDYPITIDKDVVQDECRLIDGHFKSPFTEHVPGIMPTEVETARFQMLLPRQWKGPLKPVCVHLAGTGDHYFYRRRMLLARPLLKEAGIASILLENPYYGYRKPKAQTRSSLHNVSDLFVMGGALVLESLVLFHWCERQGYGPLGITGISMGGHMASLAATNWPKPLALVPCMSWSTASSVFTQGVLSRSIPWKLLQDQYFADSIYEDEISKLIHSPEKNRINPAFQLGSDFAKHYPNNVDNMHDLHDLATHNAVDHNNHNHGNDHSNKQSTNSSSLKSGGSSSSRRASTGAKYHTMTSNSSGKRTDSSDSNNSDNNKKARLTFRERLLVLGGFKKLSRHRQKEMQDEALHFMRGLMDECTHLYNFSVPVDPSLIIIVLAKNDAYIPTDDVLNLQEYWKGAEVRYLETGHIAAFLFRQSEFRRAIIDAFDRQTEKYYS